MVPTWPISSLLARRSDGQRCTSVPTGAPATPPGQTPRPALDTGPMTWRARAVVALLTVVVLAGSALAAPTAAGGAEPVATCAGRPATVVGTAGDDRLVGTSGDDVITAGAGDDRVRGRG